MTEPPDRPAEQWPAPPGRYGDPSPGRRRVLVAVVVVVAAAFGAWLLWAALGAATPDVRASVIGYRVVDERRVIVRLEVVADRDRPVTCTVRAQDRERETVGLTRVTVAPDPDAGEDRRAERVTVPTRAEAADASLVGCRIGGR